MHRNTMPLLFAVGVAIAVLQVGSDNRSDTLILLDGSEATASERSAAQRTAYPIDGEFKLVAPNVEARAEVVLADTAARTPERWQAVIYSDSVLPRAIPVEVVSASERSKRTTARMRSDTPLDPETASSFEVASTADETGRGSRNGPLNAGPSSR